MEFLQQHFIMQNANAELLPIRSHSGEAIDVP